MDFRPGELVAVRAGSHWPELVGKIQMIHAQGMPFGWRFSMSIPAMSWGSPPPM